MRTIYKYALDITDVQRVEMPAGARLLHVANQRDELCLWALVDAARPTVDRFIGVVGTGNPAPDIDDDADYVGTAQVGSFVWHVFDGGER